MKIDGKKIAITGSEGFIGSHLTEHLLQKGCHVKALVQYNSFNSWGWLDNFDNKYENLEVVLGDIRDENFCNKFCNDVEILFHLAALIAIPFSYLAPKSYIDTNVIGTFNICNSALLNNVDTIIHTSTSEVYGTAQYAPIDELHPLQPQSPYSASKISADAMAMSFFHSFGLPLAICRPFNTYGPRQSNRAVMPTIISQALNNNGIVKIGDTSPTRDFNYIEDTVKGFLAVAENKNHATGEIINIGSGHEISILDLIMLIGDTLDINIQLEDDSSRVRPKNSEVFRLLADIKKAKDLIKYKPSITIEEGVKRTVDWFANPENLSKYKTTNYVV